MSKTFTVSDVASHNKPDNLYIIVDGDVYDLTTFQDDHPGGKKILQRVAGKDASKQFWKYHNEGILKKYQSKLQVGSLDTKPKPAPKPEPTAEPSPKTVAAAQREASNDEAGEPLEPFGDLIPFADPSWYQGVSFHQAILRAILIVAVANRSSSTHLLTSTRPMPLSAVRSASGLRTTSSPTSPSGMRPSAFPRRFTRRWAVVVTSPVS